MKKLFVALILCLPGLAAAQARVYTVPVFQSDLRTPETPYELTVGDVAIDGDSIIVAAFHNAYLFRRAANGTWSYSRSLVTVADNPDVRMHVEMKGSLAIIKIGASTTIWKKIAGQWVQAPTAAPITAPGDFAISANRIIVGANGCTADALIYEENASGIWGVASTIPAEDGTCGNTPRPVELNYNTALVRGSGNVMRSYRQSGSVWANAGNLTLSPLAAELQQPAALQSDWLVLNDLSYYRRTTGGWTRLGRLQPLDYPYGAGDRGRVLYRDSTVLVNDFKEDFDSSLRPYVYLKNAQGAFDHVATLQGSSVDVARFDISGRSIVTVSSGGRGSIFTTISVYQLPTDLTRPRMIANNFDAQDVSDFSTSAGSLYSLAGYPGSYLYRQSNQTADTAAVLEPSNWPDFQSAAAILRPNAFSRADSWVGVAVRYVDADNHYFVSFGNDDVLRLQRKQNGVVTTLAQVSHPVPVGTWKMVRLVADEAVVSVLVNGNVTLSSPDKSLTQGRVALLTSGARADLDNLEAAPTGGYFVFSEVPPFEQTGRAYTFAGGQWEANDFGETEGLRQSDTSGQALALQGLPMDDQRIMVDVTLDTFATTNPVAWYGVVARYVDGNNFYYLSLRSSNQLQIRKMANGVVSVLKAVTFTSQPGVSHRLEFSVIGNELKAIVDGQVLARAIDGELARGRFGLGP